MNYIYNIQRASFEGYNNGGYCNIITVVIVGQ